MGIFMWDQKYRSGNWNIVKYRDQKWDFQKGAGLWTSCQEAKPAVVIDNLNLLICSHCAAWWGRSHGLQGLLTSIPEQRWGKKAEFVRSPPGSSKPSETPECTITFMWDKKPINCFSVRIKAILAPLFLLCWKSKVLACVQGGMDTCCAVLRSRVVLWGRGYVSEFWHQWIKWITTV